MHHEILYTFSSFIVWADPGVIVRFYESIDNDSDRERWLNVPSEALNHLLFLILVAIKYVVRVIRPEKAQTIVYLKSVVLSELNTLRNFGEDVATHWLTWSALCFV